jgi:ketosteroid isomerase-like protein
MDSVEIDRLVRRGAEFYNQRDPEAGLELWHPDCEWHPYFSAEVEGSSGYRGHDGMRQWFRDTDEMFSSVNWEVDKVRDLGDDRVLALGRLRATGRQSGVEVNSPIGQLFEFRDGRVLRGWAYLSHEEARLAAGLEA